MCQGAAWQRGLLLFLTEPPHHVYNGTTKTNHALTYVTIKEMRRPAARGRQRQRKLKRKKRKRPQNGPSQLIFEKYQQPTPDVPGGTHGL
jgi:hypothetical protein